MSKFSYDHLHTHFTKRKLEGDQPSLLEITSTLKLAASVVGDRELYVALGACYACAYLSAGLDPKVLLQAIKTMSKESQD